jgi:uncharacterized protein (DUF362 family)
MHRRRFFKQAAIVGGALISAPLMESCSQLPTPSPLPSFASSPLPAVTTVPQAPTVSDAIPSIAPADTGITRVALVKTTDRASGVRRAVELLGINPVQGKDILLKANFNNADESPGSTHGDTLRALIESLQTMGAGRITIGDRSGMGNTRSVMERKGIFALAEELDFDVVVFDELAAEDWVFNQPPSSHWSGGFWVPKRLVEAACVVQTCNLKTHAYGGHFTISLKNAVGFAAKTVPGDAHNYMNELHNSAHQRRMIAEINTAYSPSLIVMDGIEAFVDGGPGTGTKVISELVLAGTDRIAIDAVGVAVLRMFGTTPEVSQGKIFDQQQIARAVELGLGVDSPSKIQLVTADTDSEEYARRIQEVLLA